MEELWREKIFHPQDSLPVNVPDQFSIRFNSILPFLNNIKKIDAIAARGGPLKPLSGGVYAINQKMLTSYKSCKYADHASNLGALIADKLATKFNVPAYIVDPVTTDELIDVARISGVPGIERRSRSHVLNIKFCADKATTEIGIDISDAKFIVAHLGSGFSIAAVSGGKIIDVNDALLGMGPFSVERAGSLPISGILDTIFSNKKDRKTLEQIFSRNSGLKGYLGTNQFQEIERRIYNGDTEAMLIVDAMVYQIIKEIGGLYATGSGKINGLIITGGLANSTFLINKVRKYLELFINPIIVYPGSFELEALTQGVLKILNKEDSVKTYQ